MISIKTRKKVGLLLSILVISTIVGCSPVDKAKGRVYSLLGKEQKFDMDSKEQTNNKDAETNSNANEVYKCNSNISSCGNMTVKNVRYIYQVEGNTLYRFIRNVIEPRKEVVSASGDKLLNPLLDGDKIYYIDYDTSSKKGSICVVNSDSSGKKVLLKNLDGTQRMFKNGGNIYYTKGKTLVSYSIDHKKEQEIGSDVIPNHMYVYDTRLYHQKKVGDAVFLFKGKDKVAKMYASPFVIMKDKVYYTGNYGEVQKKQGNDLDLPKCKEESKGVYYSNLSDGMKIMSLFNVTDTGLLTCSDNSLFFSTFDGQKNIGIIRLDMENRKATVSYKAKEPISSISVINNKVYFTKEGVSTLYSMTSSGSDLKEIK